MVGLLDQPSFSAASDGTETRLVMKYNIDLMNIRVVRVARAEEVTLLRTQCDGDERFVALQVDVHWARIMPRDQYNPDDANNEAGRKYIICAFSPASAQADLNALVDLLCRDAHLGSIHSTIPAGEHASYFKSVECARLDEITRLEELQREVDRKQRLLAGTARAVLQFRDSLEQREKRLERDEYFFREEKRRQPFRNLYVPVTVYPHRQNQQQRGTQTDGLATSSTTLPMQSSTGTQTLPMQPMVPPPPLPLPIQMLPPILPLPIHMPPPLPMPPRLPMAPPHQPPQPPSALPAVTRSEVGALGRAKLRQYLGLLGESTKGTPDELRARMLRYFDALGIDTYYPS